MTARKLDRRIKFTKQALKESLIELMQKIPISKISVKMLCDKADINRSTFYAHYTDQNDLLQQIQREVVFEIKELISDNAFRENSKQTLEAMSQILEYAKKNIKLLNVLLSENGDYTFQKEIMFLAQEKTITEIRNNQSVDSRTSEYLQLFVVTGCLSVLRQWLKDGAFEGSEEMAVLIAKLLYQGVSGFYQ